jgi:hypothetical protein
MISYMRGIDFEGYHLANGRFSKPSAFVNALTGELLLREKSDEITSSPI